MCDKANKNLFPFFSPCLVGGGGGGAERGIGGKGTELILFYPLTTLPLKLHLQLRSLSVKNGHFVSPAQRMLLKC